MGGGVLVHPANQPAPRFEVVQKILPDQDVHTKHLVTDVLDRLIQKHVAVFLRTALVNLFFR